MKIQCIQGVQVCGPINLMIDVRGADGLLVDGNQDEYTGATEWSEAGAGKALPERSILDVNTNDSATENTSAQALALAENVSLLQSELQSERSLISNNYKHMLDAYQNTQEQNANAAGVEIVAPLNSGSHELSLNSNPAEAAALAARQMGQRTEKKAGKGPGLRVSWADNIGEVEDEGSRDGLVQSSCSQPLNTADQGETLHKGNVLAEVEVEQASIAKPSESEYDLLAKLEELTKECTELRKERQHLTDEKEEQNEEWIMKVSKIEAHHREQMSLSISAIRCELEEVQLALIAAQKENASIKEESVKSLMLMSQACSEKDELQAALGVRGMAEKNLKEESQDYTEVLTADLNTTNCVLAEVREENTALMQKVANLEQANKTANETNENLTKKAKSLQKKNQELEALLEANNEQYNQACDQLVFLSNCSTMMLYLS